MQTFEVIIFDLSEVSDSIDHSHLTFCSCTFHDSTLFWFSFDSLPITTILRLLCHCFFLLLTANSRHCLRLSLFPYFLWFFLFEEHSFSHSLFIIFIYVISMSPKLLATSSFCSVPGCQAHYWKCVVNTRDFRPNVYKTEQFIMLPNCFFSNFQFCDILFFIYLFFNIHK